MSNRMTQAGVPVKTNHNGIIAQKTTSRSNKRWTDSEKDILKSSLENGDILSVIKVKIPGRSEHAIKRQAMNSFNYGYNGGKFTKDYKSRNRSKQSTLESTEKTDINSMLSSNHSKITFEIRDADLVLLNDFVDSIKSLSKLNITHVRINYDTNL